MIETKNFSIQELRCKCCGRADMNREFMVKLQEVRTRIRRPMELTSAFRCPAHNLAINGFNRSQHLLGRAADISTVGWSSAQLHDLLKYAYGVGMRGIGIASDFVHLDLREAKGKMWLY